MKQLCINKKIDAKRIYYVGNTIMFHIGLTFYLKHSADSTLSVDYQNLEFIKRKSIIRFLYGIN